MHANRAKTPTLHCGPIFPHISVLSWPNQEMGKLLKARMGEAGRRVPTGVMPDWVIWLASFMDPGLKQLLPILGLSNASSNEKARCATLHWP